MRILRLLQAQSGQGLFELVAVLGVFLAAIAVGVPGYLGFQDRKADKQARANLLAAVQLAEVYRTSHGSYLGMDALGHAEDRPARVADLGGRVRAAPVVLPRGRRARQDLEHLRPVPGKRRVQRKRRLRLTRPLHGTLTTQPET